MRRLTITKEGIYMFLHTYSVPLLASSLFLLSACGGGGASSGSSSDSNANTPSSHVFKAQFVYENDCQQSFPHPYVEVFLHDDDWNILDAKTVDENGEVEFVRSESNMHISIVSLSKSIGEAQNSVSFDFFVDAPMMDIGQQIFEFDNSLMSNEGCECVTGDISFSAPSGTDIDYADGSYSQLTNTQVCKANDEWQVDYALFDDTQSNVDETLAVVVNNYDELEATGAQQIPVDLEAELIDVPVQFEWYRMYQITAERHFLLANTTSSGGTLRHFPNHILSDQAVISNSGYTFFQDDASDSQILVSKRTFSMSPYDVQALQNNVAIPDFGASNVELISESGQFNFSSVTDYPFLWTYLDFESAAGHEISVFLSGTTTGTLPTLELFTGYGIFFDSLIATDVDFQFFDYANLEKSASALNSALLTGFSNPISVDNYETHYRKDYEAVNIDVDIDSLVINSSAAVAASKSIAKLVDKPMVLSKRQTQLNTLSKALDNTEEGR